MLSPSGGPLPITEWSTPEARATVYAIMGWPDPQKATPTAAPPPPTAAAAPKAPATSDLTASTPAPVGTPTAATPGATQAALGPIGQSTSGGPKAPAPGAPPASAGGGASTRAGVNPTLPSASTAPLSVLDGSSLAAALGISPRLADVFAKRQAGGKLSPPKSSQGPYPEKLI